jgi:hypothetical protein
MAMTVKFVYREIPGGREIIDVANVNSMETAELELQELCEGFNEVEKHRYGKSAVLREFVRIEALQDA